MPIETESSKYLRTLCCKMGSLRVSLSRQSKMLSNLRDRQCWSWMRTNRWKMLSGRCFRNWCHVQFSPENRLCNMGNQLMMWKKFRVKYHDFLTLCCIFVKEAMLRVA